MMCGGPHRVLSVACLATVLGLTLTAQSVRHMVVRNEAATARAVRWVAAVLRHEPGVRDREVEEIARWNSTALTDVAVEVHVIGRLMRDARARSFVMPGKHSGIPPSLVYSNEQLEMLHDAASDAVRAGFNDHDLTARGILLHTDVALLDARAGTILRFADGRDLGVQRGGDQWALARKLAASLDGRSGRQMDVRVWYRATLATLAAADEWSEAHAEAAVTQFPDDAELLFLAGSHHETLASPRVQASSVGVRLPPNLRIGIRSSGEELRLAASLLKRALDLNPAHTEGRVHYGRVLMLVDRAGDAVRYLRRAAAEAQEREQRYYAQLFLGAALETMNQRREAQSAYEAAAALFPRAQSPCLALSLLAARHGDRSEALRAVEPLLALPLEEAERADPWWHYARSSGRDAERLMMEVRERFLTRHGVPERP
jgi:tetratricopeptide (TPR) repeat protein